jgi:hypothetical protein
LKEVLGRVQPSISGHLMYLKGKYKFRKKKNYIVGGVIIGKGLAKIEQRK